VPTSAQHTGHNVAVQHNQIVIQMNEVRHLTSGCIQRRLPNVVNMIDEPGAAVGDLEIPFEQEMTMLKTISAALLAASVLAAPVLAAQSTKTTANAPVVKTTQTKTTDANFTGAKSTPGKTIQPAAAQAKPAALNANAKMGKHHRKHVSHHHRHHGKMAALKTQPKIQIRTQLKAHANTTHKIAPKVSLKPAASTTRRG
jgi:hypothetical protein